MLKVDEVSELLCVCVWRWGCNSRLERSRKTKFSTAVLWSTPYWRRHLRSRSGGVINTVLRHKMHHNWCSNGRMIFKRIVPLSCCKSRTISQRLRSQVECVLFAGVLVVACELKNRTHKKLSLYITEMGQTCHLRTACNVQVMFSKTLYLLTLPVTWQRWWLHHSIRHRPMQKPHAACKHHGSMFYRMWFIADRSFTLWE